MGVEPLRQKCCLAEAGRGDYERQRRVLSRTHPLEQSGPVRGADALLRGRELATEKPVGFRVSVTLARCLATGDIDYVVLGHRIPLQEDHAHKDTPNSPATWRV